MAFLASAGARGEGVASPAVAEYDKHFTCGVCGC